jgi:hypothetical protein
MSDAYFDRIKAEVAAEEDRIYARIPKGSPPDFLAKIQEIIDDIELRIEDLEEVFEEYDERKSLERDMLVGVKYDLGGYFEP